MARNLIIHRFSKLYQKQSPMEDLIIVLIPTEIYEEHKLNLIAKTSTRCNKSEQDETANFLHTWLSHTQKKI